MNDKKTNPVPIEDELARHGICVINTRGRSMRPLLKAGDAVNIMTKDRSIKKYDVVLYKSPHGGYILHRVIGFKGDVCIIRGDNTYSKEFVPEAEILGYMLSYIKGGKVKKVTSFGYKLYSRFWNIIYIPRKIIRKAFSIFKRKKSR